MDRGEKEYKFQHCDLKEVVRETVDSYRPQLEANGFSVRLSLPDEDVRMNGDCDGLSQVLVNLLSNAEKYSADGKEISVELKQQTERLTSRRGDIPLASSSPCPRVELRVLDRGPGVPRGCEQKIFEQFYRANDSLSSGIQGSGLGLTLARQIVRAHGGELRYEPRDGGGSCFVVSLPMIAGCDENKDPDRRG
jgi:signal transduction histidine kinase